MFILKKAISCFIAANLFLSMNFSVSAFDNDKSSEYANVATVTDVAYKSSSGSEIQNHVAIMEDILGDSLNDFKNYITESIYNNPDKIKISQFNIPNTSIATDALCDYIYFEIPEAFNFLEFSYSRNSSCVLYIYPKYVMTAEEYQAKLKNCNDIADKMLKGIANNSSLEEYEKALLVHDRLALNCEFNYYVAENQELANDTFAYTMYGAIAEGDAVCLGYAEAYNFLLSKIGIKSKTCISWQMGHAWNIVYIDGNAYHVDVSWDDGFVNGGVEHNYFLLSTNAFYSGVNGTQGHVATDYINEPTSTYFDRFYWQRSYTAFQLIGNELYYFNNNSGQLIRQSDNKVLYTVNDKWKNNSNSNYFSGNYSKLSSNGRVLFISDSKSVIEFNVNDMSSAVIFTPNLSVGSYYSVFGMIYSDGYIICDLFNSPYRDKADMTRYEKMEYKSEILKGDADEDGMLSAKDVILLRRALVGGWNVNIILEISDYDNNGIFQSKDILQFRKQITNNKE